MISVEEAKKLIVESTEGLNPEPWDISKSLGMVLSEDIFSPINYPSFDQSAMDGFAVFYSDFLEKREIEIIGEAPAGNPFKGRISRGQSVRIFTGGKIPEGADAVVVQEKVSIENGKLVLEDSRLVKWENIRKEGSQVKRGDVVLKKGTILKAGAIGFLASLGIVSVKVFPKPRVSLIVTGNELQKPGQPLISGQIYESNSFALISALEAMNIFPKNVLTITDNEESIKDSLRTALKNSDLILLSGGISVGKYDFVGKSLHELQVINIFYKIAQKPGKPVFFGRKENCLVFGLPGNPGSALSCFYEYVLPALKIMQGQSVVFLPKRNVPVSSAYMKKVGLSLFLKGKINSDGVDILTGQESNNIGSFALADCLVYLPAEKGNMEPGETVEVHLLPQ